MITATYYAAIENEEFTIDAPSTDIAGNYINGEKIKQNLPIENYAAFFGDGIPLYDNSLIFADENTYLGFVGNIAYLNVHFSELKYIENGITIIFDRIACEKIEVYSGENDKFEVSTEDPTRPLNRYLYFRVEEGVYDLKIKFSGIPENGIMTLKGLALGRIIDIKVFFEFNHIIEMRPLGDDLPINQIQSTVYLTDDFYDEEGQRVVYYDKGEVLEETFLVNSDFEKNNHFALTSQSLIYNLSEFLAE